MQQMKQPFSRTRHETLANHVTPVGYDQYTVTNGVKTQGSISSGLVSLVSDYSDMADWVTPGYAQRVAAGEIINHPMTHVTTLYNTRGASSFEATGTVGSTVHTWKMHGFPLFAAGDLAPVGVQRVNVSNLKALVETQALAGVQAPNTASLVSIGEGKQTLAMLASPLKGLGKIFGQKLKTATRAKSVRTINNRTYNKKSGKAVVLRNTLYGGQGIAVAGNVTAASILGVNLGWKPLMQDVDTILHKIPALENLARRSSRGKATATESWTTTTLGSIPSTGIAATIIQTFTETVTARCVVLYADGFEVKQHFGLRLADIPDALWNLIPLSFVVDYIVNVSEYLNAVRATLTSRILAASTTVEINTTVTRQYVITGLPYPYTQYTHTAPVASTSSRVKTRTPVLRGASLAYTPLSIAITPSRVQNLLGLALLPLLALQKVTKPK